MLELTVNGERRTLDSPPDTPLLWVLRDELGLDAATIAALEQEKVIGTPPEAV